MIAAGGHHATTLHWNRNDATIGAEDLLLLDAGVEVNSLYTGDLTRTWPVGGRFSGAQRQVYEHVLAAEQAAMSCLAGRARSSASTTTCARGCSPAAWPTSACSPVSAEESLSPDSGLHRRWTLCAPGHMLGLDVHDCSQAREDRYIGGRLRAGMVLTVEPGLYFQPGDELVPAGAARDGRARRGRRADHRGRLRGAEPPPAPMRSTSSRPGARADRGAAHRPASRHAAGRRGPPRPLRDRGGHRARGARRLVLDRPRAGRSGSSASRARARARPLSRCSASCPRQRSPAAPTSRARICSRSTPRSCA